MSIRERHQQETNDVGGDARDRFDPRMSAKEKTAWKERGRSAEIARQEISERQHAAEQAKLPEGWRDPPFSGYTGMDRWGLASSDIGPWKPASRGSREER